MEGERDIVREPDEDSVFIFPVLLDETAGQVGQFAPDARARFDVVQRVAEVAAEPARRVFEFEPVVPQILVEAEEPVRLLQQLR